MTLEAILVGALAVGVAAGCGGQDRAEETEGEDRGARVAFWVSVQRDTLLVEASEPMSQPACGAGQERLTWGEQGGVAAPPR
jgi:hypothetical protein